MKKKILLFILFLGFSLFPCSVSASSEVYIENYYVDATLEESGDILVKELILLNGSYNGYERTILYENINTPAFRGDKNSFEGSDIYNGSGLELVSIKEIKVPSSYDFDLLYSNGTPFHSSYITTIDEGGIYDEIKIDGGYRYRIYLPSYQSTKGFYVEYRLKDMAIQYSDVAEIGWNIFSNMQQDRVEHFFMKFHLPQNKNELRAWAHGPLNGNINIENKNLVTVQIDDLKPGNPMDIRLVFDKEQVPNVVKREQMNALPLILEVEQERADIANRARKNARIMYYGCIFLCATWIIGLIILLIYIYYRHDKEYKSEFNGKYFRDIPDDFDPSTVGYLFHHQIRTVDLSAMILNLVDKKVISFEEDSKKKKDYILHYHPGDLKLTYPEKETIHVVFGKSETRKLSDLKKEAKSSYSSFLNDYQRWKNVCTDEALEHEFFEKKGTGVILAGVYALLAFPIGFVTIVKTQLLLLPIIMFFMSALSIIYLVAFYKRSKVGNEAYQRWLGLKRFLNDFGKFETKDLPQIALWNKYLVYAVTFGCADKLIKVMKIRVNELGPNYAAGSLYYDYHYMNSMLLFHHSLNRSVNQAVNGAYNAQMARSTNSSGSGFGGGFSSGGGSFGGGGGGGHF